MPKVSTNISLDVELKKESQALFAELGMDLTTAITVFLKQSLRVQGFPFSITRDTPNPETIGGEAPTGIYGTSSPKTASNPTTTEE